MKCPSALITLWMVNWSMNEPLSVSVSVSAGTRDSGQPDYVTMAQFLNDTAGDGFNGDTMGSVPEDFYRYSVEHFGRPIALEPEGGGGLDSMNWDTVGWGFVLRIALYPAEV